MFSKAYERRKEISPSGFRYRGKAASRLENLTDAVFGFSITLLVIASEVPTTYVELEASMYGFSGFIFCILLLLAIWNNHSNFFLRYGMQDGITKLLTFLFLFLLLFYIYPLKYLFSFLGTAIYVQLMIDLGDVSDALIMAADRVNEAAMGASQWKDLMVRFGLGFFFIYLLLGLMHLNALRQKANLELNFLEEFETRTSFHSYLLLSGVALISMIIVIILGGEYAALSGTIYGIIPMVLLVQRRFRAKRYKSLKSGQLIASSEDD